MRKRIHSKRELTRIYNESLLGMENVFKVPFVRGLRVTRDISYCLDKSLKLDLYENRQPSIRPVFIYFHGGGFFLGDKAKRERMLKNVASKGYIVVNVNYGSGLKYPYPHQVRNCALALKWVEENFQRYNFDLSNIFLGGDGAGAFLATQLALLNSNKNYAKDLDALMVNLKIKGLVLLRGIYDLSAVSKKPTGHFKKYFKSLTIAKTYHFEKEEEGDTIAKTYHFEKEEEGDTIAKIVDLKRHINYGFPSVYLAHYDKDYDLYSSSHKFVDALIEHEVPLWEVKGITIRGLRKAGWYNGRERKKRIVQGAIKFLDRVCNQSDKTRIQDRYIQYNIEKREVLKV